MARADHSGAYKHLPIRGVDAHAAVVPVRNPEDGEHCDFKLKTQHVGWAAAVFHFTFFSRKVAPLARSGLALPRVGYYDDYDIIAPVNVIEAALDTFAKLNGVFRVQLKSRKSEAGPEVEFAVRTDHFTDLNPNELAEVPIPAERADRLTERLVGMTQVRSYSIFSARKLGGLSTFCAAGLHGSIRPGGS